MKLKEKNIWQNKMRVRKTLHNLVHQPPMETSDEAISAVNENKKAKNNEGEEKK